MVNLIALDELSALAMLAVVTLVHELGAPVPMSPAALLVGARAATGAIDPVLPVVAIVIATLVGNALWFAAGRLYGVKVVQWAGRLSGFAGKHAQRNLDGFDQWGPWLLVVGRFVPGASLLTPVLAGAAGMRSSRFALLTAAGALLHAMAIIGAGMLMRDEIESVLNSLPRFGGYMLGVFAGALTLYLAWRRYRARTAAAFTVQAHAVAS